MSAPPVPPRPYDFADPQRSGSLPPPVPPLPPNMQPGAAQYNNPYESSGSLPHFERPLIAPRPHRLDPSIPANMARNLDDQVSHSQQYRQSYAAPHPPPPPPLHAQASYPGYPTQNPNPPNPANWSPWAYQQGPSSARPQFPDPAEVSKSIANLSLVSSPISIPAPPMSAPPSQFAARPPQAASPASAVASLTAPLPLLSQLESATNIIQQPNHDPTLKISWCRDILFLVERQRHESITPSTDPIVGPVQIADPALARLAPIAVRLILQLSGSQPPVQGTKLPPHVSEAIFHRAALAASGAFPEFIPHNPRIAFRDFEAAARGGHAAAWFRLGRDYENFNDHTHAKDCFERGVKLGVESCLYRMGMAHLLGQLSLPANPSVALPLLHRAATLASVDVPQPAYVYALLLLAEFTQVTVPPSLFAPLIPPNSSPTLEARKHLERAAYLHFAAAQYKLGHAYEFAEPPFPFDPLLSVQYYSLASQQGESEADMALSKWFLCGSGGATVAGSTDVSAGFEKDESLALTFAEKAAKKGLPSAEFALGYYAEVGVGRAKDINEALMWYRKANHGNTDASARLSALSGPVAQTLSRQEHDSITENKLVRRRTMAAQRAETQPLSPPWEGQTFPTLKEHQQQQQGPQRLADGRAVVDVIRKTSVLTEPIRQDSLSETANRQYLPNWDNNPQQPVRTASPGAMGGGRRNQSPGRERIPRPDYQSTSSPPVPVGGQGQGGGRMASPGPGANAGRLNRLRLNLEDQGPVPSPQPSQQQQPQPPQTAVQPTPKPPQTAGPPKTGGKTPQTFAEMGFQGAKAEKDDCIIM